MYIRPNYYDILLTPPNGEIKTLTSDVEDWGNQLYRLVEKLRWVFNGDGRGYDSAYLLYIRKETSGFGEEKRVEKNILTVYCSNFIDNEEERDLELYEIIRALASEEYSGRAASNACSTLFSRVVARNDENFELLKKELGRNHQFIKTWESILTGEWG